MPFEKNVFINCPFDDNYNILLRPLLFTILHFQLEPKISQTQSSSIIRINQIKQYIRDSKYSIHDLSRSKSMKKNELPRFNMPYELGLDIGCAEYGAKKFKQKKILILETNRYHYQKVLSDIAGQDVENHDNNPATLIIKIRNWFSSIDSAMSYPSARNIWITYNKFYNKTKKNLLNKDFTQNEIENMPVTDFIKFAREYIGKFVL